jgi:hypothetical protein
MEGEELPLMEAATKQQTCEGTAVWEHLTCAIVICRVCELVTAL